MGMFDKIAGMVKEQANKALPGLNAKLDTAMAEATRLAESAKNKATELQTNFQNSQTGQSISSAAQSGLAFTSQHVTRAADKLEDIVKERSIVHSVTEIKQTVVSYMAKSTSQAIDASMLKHNVTLQNGLSIQMAFDLIHELVAQTATQLGTTDIAILNNTVEKNRSLLNQKLDVLFEKVSMDANASTLALGVNTAVIDVEKFKDSSQFQQLVADSLGETVQTHSVSSPTIS